MVSFPTPLPLPNGYVNVASPSVLSVPAVRVAYAVYPVPTALFSMSLCSFPFIVRVRLPMLSLSVTFPSRYQAPFTYISWAYCLAAVTVPSSFFCTTLSPLITGLSASNSTLLSAPTLSLPSLSRA